MRLWRKICKCKSSMIMKHKRCEKISFCPCFIYKLFLGMSTASGVSTCLSTTYFSYSGSQLSFIYDTQFPHKPAPTSKLWKSIFCGFKSCQIQDFLKDNIARKYAPLTAQLLVSGIQPLYSVCCVNNLPNSRRKFKNMEIASQLSF